MKSMSKNTRFEDRHWASFRGCNCLSRDPTFDSPTPSFASIQVCTQLRINSRRMSYLLPLCPDQKVSIVCFGVLDQNHCHARFQRTWNPSVIFVGTRAVSRPDQQPRPDDMLSGSINPRNYPTVPIRKRGALSSMAKTCIVGKSY